jgi:hypothetical protein
VGQAVQRPGNARDYPFSLTSGPDGATVFVTGYSYGETSGADYATIAYDATTGAARWARRYNGPGNNGDYANAVAVGPDGSTVFVTGQSWGSASDSDYATIAYDATTGHVRWAR